VSAAVSQYSPNHCPVSVVGNSLTALHSMKTNCM